MSMLILLLFACAAFCGIRILGFVLKLVFFPIRLILGLVFGIGGAIFGLLVTLIVTITIVGAIVAAIAAVVVPSIPVVLFGLLIWALFRGFTNRAPVSY